MDQIFAALPAPVVQFGLPALLGIVAALFVLAGRGPRRRFHRRPPPEGLDDSAEPYRAYPVLNAAERRLWAEMERVLHDHFHHRCRILAQVALPEFVFAEGKRDFWAISGKRVDFLIVDAGFRPVCAIEYQGAGHHGANVRDRMRARLRDHEKRRALRSAGVPLVEIPEHWDTALLRDRLGDVTGRRAPEVGRLAAGPAGQRARA
jgi:hypothetical protein